MPTPMLTHVLLFALAGAPPASTTTPRKPKATPTQPAPAPAPTAPPQRIQPQRPEFPLPGDPANQPTYQAPRDRNPISTADRNPIGGQVRGGSVRAACATAADCASQLAPWQGQTIPWGRSRYFMGGVPFGNVTLGAGSQEAVVGPDVPLVLVGGANATVDLSGAQLINLLGDPLYSPEGKQQTEVELIAGGLASVPALVAALGDRRAYGTRPVPGPDGTMKAEPITVGQQCEALLYQIITPQYRSRFEKGSIKVKDPVMFTVTNWPAWWDHNRSRGLGAIHKDISDATDRYWQQGGTEQKL